MQTGRPCMELIFHVPLDRTKSLVQAKVTSDMKICEKCMLIVLFCMHAKF